LYNIIALYLTCYEHCADRKPMLPVGRFLLLSLLLLAIPVKIVAYLAVNDYSSSILCIASITFLR